MVTDKAGNIRYQNSDVQIEERIISWRAHSIQAGLIQVTIASSCADSLYAALASPPYLSPLFRAGQYYL
ncbi:hypothetical protein EPA93_23085 [Ktedonosporobacter rubrisoli]|uniref:Uncharacterized protein n=1 Tax=Ktedonosporobacter rubrisoli TaxID=2509675 RepID=A0A4P6JT16_KTERU|nr:hypothetical protein [Ktedonosporobacter rubrisoli]QBD78709.1 hypothetical protein EPA93_23085 [Ktedonosporobacter rubrisoli]